ncbi:MAG: 1-acyl-sn-glycerol-3-phosphate acyltransferase, partial [Chloroflexota bacterium]
DWTASVSVESAEQIPVTGPLVITSNHPGIIDAMAVLANLPRTDVLTIARTRNLLHTLHNVSEHIIFVRDGEETAALRSAIRHLRKGGAILTFPRGEIEPDPALYPEAAADSLDDWSESVELLVRRVPGTQLVPAYVSGVISERALRHPLSRIYRQRAVRDYVAATLQIMFARFRDTHVTVTFGAPLAGSDIKISNISAAIREAHP